MLPLGIILLLSHAVDFLSANAVEPYNCIMAEDECLKDSRCKVSYNDFKNCSRTGVMNNVNSARCKEAAAVLSQNTVMICKCQRRMKREEHCLNIFWSLHPDNVYGYLDSNDSPYTDEIIDKKGENEYTRLAAESDQYSETNGCVKEANICSSNSKCSKLKNEYVMQCASQPCDQQKCHHYLREFFKKVPLEFTKRFLFCQCNQESNCAERRRKNILPQCSFEERVKKNCLEMRDACLSNTLCKSRFLDYQKQCQLYDKTTDSCPPESHHRCIQAYIRMIGTVMTPNFINNSTMGISLWCTCEGSGDQQDECRNVLSMFTSNKCLKNAVKMDINNSNTMEIDPEPENTFTGKKSSLREFPSINEQVEEGHPMQILPVKTIQPENRSGSLTADITLISLITALFGLVSI